MLYGGLAVFRPETEKFEFLYCPESVRSLFGYDSREFEEVIRQDALAVLCPEDRQRVEAAITSARARGVGIWVAFPVKRNRVHQNCFEMEGWEKDGAYYLLFGGMSQKYKLFQSIASENVDEVYVVDKESYGLLYANNLKAAYWVEEGQDPPKCYQVVYGKDSPCSHCTCSCGGSVCETNVEEGGRFFTTRVMEGTWNGIPAYIKYVRDTTGEVTARQEKERLEKYFETVLKYLPGGVAVVRHEVGGALTPEYLSNGFGEMVDMPMEEAWEMYRKNALSGVHPDDREYVRRELDRCIQERCERQALQYRLRTGRGDYIWVDAKFSVIQCDGGDAMVYADYNDITQERKMQERMRQQYREQIYQHYAVNGPDTLILGHCNITRNRIIEIEDHTHSDLLERFGREREGFFRGLGTLVADEEERKTFYEKYLNEPSARAYESGVREVAFPCFIVLPGRQEGRYVRFCVDLVATPDTGDITGILPVTDITEKTIHNMIFRKLSSLNYDLVADVDLLHDRYEVVSGGDAYISETCGRQTERVRRVVDELVVDSEKDYVARMLDPVYIRSRLESDASYAFTYSIRTEDGNIQTKNMTVTAVDLRLGRVCLVRTDVTEMLAAERKTKRELERALSAAEKASRVKSDFLSSMSHDIRTPMNAIMGMTTLALANLDQPEKTRDYLEKISVSSQHLLSLINDVLDMSQIEQSKIHMNPQTICMEDLIRQIAAIMASPAKNAGLRFVIEEGLFRQSCFKGDLLRIKQILLNLISNAVKFTPEGGTVRFLVEEMESTEKERVRYCFTVSDTGIGMSEEFQAHLFEPFCRSATVNKVEGTGLGLSITKGLVELMGGEIRVDSCLNRGTTFRVELEFERAAAAEEGKPGAPADSGEASI